MTKDFFIPKIIFVIYYYTNYSENPIHDVILIVYLSYNTYSYLQQINLLNKNLLINRYINR